MTMVVTLMMVLWQCWPSRTVKPQCPPLIDERWMLFLFWQKGQIQYDMLSNNNTKSKRCKSQMNYQPWLYLISWASIVPPPSASKAVKIQLSLLSGELRSPTLFALMVTTWSYWSYWYSCISHRKPTCKYLIVLLETESPTVVVVEDFEERFGKHPVLWGNYYFLNLLFDILILKLIWNLESNNLPFWTRGNLLWGWALPEIVHGTDPTPQAPPPSPFRILPPGFL